MKKFPLFLISLFILAALSSCSVQKRLYRPGYDVDWNVNTGQQIRLPENVPTHRMVHSCNAVKKAAPEHFQILIKPGNEINYAAPVVNNGAEVPKNNAIKSTAGRSGKQENSPPLTFQKKENPKVNLFAVLSFVLAAFSFTSLWLVLSSLALTGFFIEILAIVVLASLGGIITALAGLKQLRSDPAKFRGKNYAVIGLTFSLIFLVISLAYLVGIAIFFLV